MVANSHRLFELNNTVDKVFPNAVQALTKMNCKVTLADEKNGILQAKKGIGFKSWGENIKVSFVPSVVGTKVEVTSESTLPTTLVDAGVNEGNINDFQKFLMELLG